MANPESYYERFSRMTPGDTYSCTATDCTWTFTATPGDTDGIVRHNQHVFVRYECPLYPEHVEPGSAMAGGKLAKTLNLLALQRQRELPGRRAGLSPAGANLNAAQWLALIILGQQSQPATIAEIHTQLQALNEHEEDLAWRALSRHHTAGKAPRPDDRMIEIAFKVVRRIDLVECGWRTRPWKWRLTAQGRGLLAAGLVRRITNIEPSLEEEQNPGGQGDEGTAGQA